MSRKKFSVLIPVYNVECYIKECLDSLTNQTYQNFDALLIDDGSTDRSGEICDDYKNRYPDKFTVLHQKNAGLLATRRTAIQHAKGEYCVFLDSDDTLEINCLETIAKILNDNLDTDIVLYNLNRWYADTEEFVKQDSVFRNGKILDIPKQSIYVKLIDSFSLNSLATKAIKTQLLKADDTDYKQFYDNSYAEDLLQSLYPVTHARKIIYCSEPLYNYRINSGSMMNNFNLENVDKKFNTSVWRQTLKYMSSWGMSTPEMLEKYHVKRLHHLISSFRECFHAADSWSQRKACVDFDWFSLLLPETLQYKESNHLSKVQKLQLYLIQNKHLLGLYVFYYIRSNIYSLTKRTQKHKVHI